MTSDADSSPFSPAFVIGTGRCGSTLVHEILARHADVSFLSNLDDLNRVPWRGGINGSLYRRLPSRLTQKGRIRFAPSEGYRILEREVSPLLSEPVRDIVADDVTPWMADRLDGVFRRSAQQQGQRLFIHKFTGWPRAGFLDAVFPGARYIHIVRDGRAVANSWMQMPWWRGHRGPDEWHFGPLDKQYQELWESTERSFVGLAGIGWLMLLDAFDRASDRIGADRWLQIRYEDILLQPEKEFRRMTDFLGLEWTPQFAASLSSYRFGSGRREAFRRDLTTPQIDLLDDLLRERLEQLGYSVAPSDVPVEQLEPSESDRPVAELPTVRQSVVLDPGSEGSVARTVRRARRHIYWARTQGVGRLIEEDELHPVERLTHAARHRTWQARHPISPKSSTPVYLVGLQRSGTNMLARGLAASLEFDVHNENDRAVFDRFMLRSDEVVRSTVLASKSRYVLFKPLCDSHRAAQLLDSIATPSPGRAIWMARSVDGRLRSAVAKFGDVNRRVLTAIADGSGLHTWQAQGLSDERLALVRSFNYDEMSPESAAALFWYLRNSLVFDLALAQRPDVRIVWWDSLVRAPEAHMGAVCEFLGLEFSPAVASDMAVRGSTSAPVSIDPRIRELCTELEGRLEGSAELGIQGLA